LWHSHLHQKKVNPVDQPYTTTGLRPKRAQLHTKRWQFYSIAASNHARLAAHEFWGYAL
jgi:hypothetical protein